jgi:hydrogenase nickel incorporation protein HypA/HybF
MHELSIAQAVVDGIVEQLDGARVTGVRLEIGRQSGVLPDAVSFCFGLVCEGTPLEGAWLDILEPDGPGLRVTGVELPRPLDASSDKEAV